MPTAASQYISLVYCTRTENAQALAIFKWLGNPLYNVQAEADWSTLKPDCCRLAARLPASKRLNCIYYLATYFNLDRHHYALSYRSPHQCERDCLASIS